MATRNFRKMATGESGIGYEGSKFYAVQKDLLIAGVKESTFSKSFKRRLILLHQYYAVSISIVHSGKNQLADPQTRSPDDGR